jgi:predicted RND superfamily exporter protein
MKKLFQLIIGFPKLTLLFALVLTLFFALQLPKLRVETDVDVYLPDEHPAVKYEEMVDEIFNYQESMAIAVFNEGPDGIFNPRTLAKIQRMTDEISQVQYVIAQREEDVKSISTMKNIIGTEEGIEVVPLMEEVPTTRDQIDELQENLYGNEMFIGWLVSEDGTATVILAKIEDGPEKQSHAYGEIKKIVEREQGGGDRIYIAGQPVLEATFVDYIIDDMKLMLPIVILTIVLLLYFSFGSLRGVVLPLMVVVAGVIWSMGIMSMMRIPVYDLTNMTPVILIAIGCAYGIHILNRYYEEAMREPARERSEIVLESMLTIWQPVVMSSLTTAVGFASLCTSSLIPVRCFGIFTALGISCALVFSLTFIPAGLVLVKVPDTGKAKKQGFDIGGGVHKHANLMLGFMGYGVYRYRVGICAVFALLVVLAGIGCFRLRANDSWVEMFPHDSDIYISNELICEKLNGTVSVNVVVEGDEADIIKSPSLLRKMDGLQQLAEAAEEVGGTISIADYIKRMHKVMNEDKEEYNTIPDTRELIAQYLLLYSLSGDPDDFDEVVDYDYRQANITVMLRDDHTAVVKRLAERFGRYIEEHFEDVPVRVNFTGYAYITQVVIDLAVQGLLGSIALSIVFIYLMTALMFRSFTGGIYNIIPITMAMLLNFGIMGILGITIRFSNSVAFAVAMGIGVDYAIHLVFKFQREVANSSDLGAVNTVTLMTSGKAILFNAVVVTAGFVVLLASNFTGHQILGQLLSLSMVTSFLGSITLLPAALSLFRPAFVFRKNRIRTAGVSPSA